jgi:cation transport regulator ChaC
VTTSDPSRPSAAGASRNDGIIIGGSASITGSALAAGHGAHAEYHAGTGTDHLDEVRRQLAEIRSHLADLVPAGELTERQHTAVAGAVDDAEQALDSTRSGGRLPALTERLHTLVGCLTGAGVLAEAVTQLRGIIATLSG